jgi:D-3-phosphoglycerate dehydrogenase
MFKIVRVDSNGADDTMLDERKALEGHDDVILETKSCTSEQEIIKCAIDADVVITHSAMLTKGVQEALPKCKAIIRYGVGYDSVDVEAATENGILVVNVPDFCGEEVSNHVMMLILAACKKLVFLNNLTKKGMWSIAKSQQKPMGCVHGETLGIIGCGNLGRHVAKKASAFHMNVIGYDKYLQNEIAEQAGIKLVDLDELLETSDYITLHVALTSETHHMINAQSLKKMKHNCVLINTSRGPVIDEHALIVALQNNEIYMACLDVYEQEPVDISNPLLQMENTILTPHSASYSDAAFTRLKTNVIEEALRIKDGIMPFNVVNKDVIPKVELRKV